MGKVIAKEKESLNSNNISNVTNLLIGKRKQNADKDGTENFSYYTYFSF